MSFVALAGACFSFILPVSYKLVYQYKDSILLFIYFWLCSAASGTFVPWSRIEPMPPAVEVQTLKQQTARKVPKDFKQEVSEKGIWRSFVGKHE